MRLICQSTCLHWRNKAINLIQDIHFPGRSTSDVVENLNFFLSRLKIYCTVHIAHVLTRIGGHKPNLENSILMC